mgnify:CR=1 FL=1
MVWEEAEESVTFYADKVSGYTGEKNCVAAVCCPILFRVLAI